MEISVIVPVFNAASYLRAALDSLVAQTWTDWECLCVDDGSTDGSREILREYAERDRRFRMLPQSCGGVSAARNAGLDAATGTFIAFLDADDLMHPQCLELALAASRDACGSIVAWDWQRDDPQGFIERRYDAVGDLREVREAGPCVWNKLYPRAALAGIRFCTAATVGEDIAFLLRVTHKNRTGFARIDHALYFYREREGSAMHRVLRHRDFVARTAVIEDMLETLADDAAARKRFCRENLPGLLKQFYRHLRMVEPPERDAACDEFARELQALRKRGFLCPQRGSFKDLKYYLKFLLMSGRAK